MDGQGTLLSRHHSAQEPQLTADRNLCCLSGDGQLRDMKRISLPGKSARVGTATGCFPFPKVSKIFDEAGLICLMSERDFLLLF